PGRAEREPGTHNHRTSFCDDRGYQLSQKTTACDYGSQPSRGRPVDRASSLSSPSISCGSAITTRPPVRSTSGTTAFVNGSSIVVPFADPLGGAISMMSPAPKL